MARDDVALEAGRGAAVASRVRARCAGLLLVVLSLPTVVLLAWSLAPPLNHDVAAILHFAERWIAGERLYVDLIDINPPLVFLLSAVAVVAAHVVGFGPIVALQSAVLGAACWSLWLCARIAWSQPGVGVARLSVLAVLLPFLLLGFPLEMFGQREHLMLIGALPYLLMAERRGTEADPPRRLEALAAVLAGVLFGLKPYFLAVPLLVEAYLLLVLGARRTLSRPTPWLLGALWLAQLAITVRFFGAYITMVVPFAVAAYQSLDFSPLGAALDGFGALPLAALVVLVPLAFSPRAGAAVRLVALAAIGAWVAGVAQGKGWPYHFLPAEALAVLLAALVAVERSCGLAPASREGALGPPLASVGVLLGLGVVLVAREPVRDRIDFDKGEIAQLASFYARVAPRQRVLVLSAALNPFYPALNYGGAITASRFMTMWMVQGNYQSCPKDGRRFHRMREMPRSERYAWRAVTADLVDRRPQLIIVDDLTGIPTCQGKSFDLLAYFLRNPLFAEAFAQYESIASPLATLRVFRRRAGVVQEP